MQKYVYVLTIVISLFTSDLYADTTHRGKEKSRQSVGLVLSGGGAKGIAHVGVIKALEENDIPIDYVTGTSMGAIVGSLYSCGWSPEKMLKFFTSEDFTYWSTGTIDKRLTYYLTQPAPTPQWLQLNVNLKDTTAFTNQIIPTNLISPLPMNIEFLRLYTPYTAQCNEDFNKLFVPFRCVCSDVYHKHKIVSGSGSLGDAVRASMSFPLVFKPIKLDGVLVYDGGIYDNFPVDVMEQTFHPDFVIGVSVSSPDKKPQEGDVYSQLEDMIIQNNNYDVPEKDGIKIQVPVLNFGVLDFGQAMTIYDIGYNTGLSMVDSIKKRVSSRIPLEEVTRRRAEFANSTPEIMFDSVKVEGAKDAGQRRYLEYLFNNGNNRPFGMAQAQNAYYRAVTDGTLTNLLPQAELGRDGNNTLLLEASVKRPFSVGVGGWITSTANSMLYLDMGYHTLSFNSLDINLSGWVGQSYLAGMASAKFNIRSEIPSYFRFEGVMSRQRYYDSQLLFYENTSPTFITENDNFLRICYERAIGLRTKGYAGIGWGYMSDSYFPNNFSDYSQETKDKTKYGIWAFRTGIESALLNDALYPNEGYDWHVNLRLSHESSTYLPAEWESMAQEKQRFGRATIELYGKKFIELHKHFSIGVMGQAMGTLGTLRQNYTATLIHCYAFAPTPSTKNYFNEAFRSDSFVAAGAIPVWNPFGKFQLRGDFYLYAPIRNLTSKDGKAAYDGWFRRVDFIGELAAVYNFSFASLSLYGNYLSHPAGNWNFGINFGLFFQAPKLLQ